MAFLAEKEVRYSDLIEGLVAKGLMAKGTLSKHLNALLEEGKVRKKIDVDGGTFRPVYFVPEQHKKEADKYRVLQMLEAKGDVEPYLAMMEASHERLLAAIEREELEYLLLTAAFNILPERVLKKALSSIPSVPKEGTPEMKEYHQEINHLISLLKTPEGRKAIDSIGKEMVRKDHLLGLSKAIHDVLSFRIYSPLPIKDDAELDVALWREAVKLLIMSTEKLKASTIDYKKLELLQTKKIVLTIEFDVGKYLKPGWGVYD